MAIDKDNVMFIADGTSIRYVDKDGIINTLIGLIDLWFLFNVLFEL